MAGPNANLPNGTQLVGIPLNDVSPWYDFQIALSGVQYTISIRYNGRMDRWVMDLSNAVDTPIIMGVPLLIGVNLLGRFAGQPNIPVGTFSVTE